MDTPHWPQQMEGGGGGGGSSSCSKGNSGNLKGRPGKEQALKCPRCNSSNTKFCYYNNYSLSQPRYFCKACRRYWTEGGSLRNVPVGGGSRKNKRPISSSDKKINGSDHPHQNPKVHHAQDLNLAIFPPPPTNPSSTSSSSSHLLLGSFMAVPGGGGGGGFGLHELKPGLGFSLDGFGNGGYGDLHHHNHQDQTAAMFPIEDLKQTNGAAAAAAGFDHHGGGESGGFWNGMLGGGSW